jgi:hypothetical protein
MRARSWSERTPAAWTTPRIGGLAVEEVGELCLVGDVHGHRLDTHPERLQLPYRGRPLALGATRFQVAPQLPRRQRAAAGEHQPAGAVLCQPARDAEAEPSQAAGDEVAGVGPQGPGAPRLAGDLDARHVALAVAEGHAGVRRRTSELVAQLGRRQGGRRLGVEVHQPRPQLWVLAQHHPAEAPGRGLRHGEPLAGLDGLGAARHDP